MKSILSVFFIIPVNSITSLDLFANRLRLMEPTGKRNQASQYIYSIFESYNKVVAAPRGSKPAYDMYDATLYTVLCGISTGSTSITPGNHCRPLSTAETKTAEEVLRDIFSKAYPKAYRSADLVEKRPTQIDLEPYAYRDALIRKALAANGSEPPKNVGFDEISQVWNGLVSPKLSKSITIPDNKAIIYGLLILNKTGKDSPISPKNKGEILIQFCIIFQGYKVVMNFVDDCRPVSGVSPTADIEEAKQKLKVALKPAQLRRRSSV